MSVIYNKSKVRLRLDVLSFDSPCDILRSNGLKFRRCNDIAFEIGIFHGSEVIDISNFDNINLSISEMDESQPPSGEKAVLLFKSISELTNIASVDEWNNGTSQHGVIEISAEENSIAAGEYWMSIWAVTNEQQIITLGAGVCSILETGGVDFVPPEPKSKYYTQLEIDSLFISSEKLNEYYTKTASDDKFTDKNELKQYPTLEYVNEHFVSNDILASIYITSQEIKNIYADKDTLVEYYTKVESDSKFIDEHKLNVKLNDYLPTSEIDKSYLAVETISNYYTKTESDNKYALKGEDSNGSGDLSSCLLKSANLSDLQSVESARDNLCLGNLSLQNADDITISGGELSGVSIANGDILESSITNSTIADSSFSKGTITSSNISDATITGGTISGINSLAISDGGTGANVKSQAFNNLSPLSSKGEILIHNGTENIALPIGSDSQVLAADSTSVTGVKWVSINTNNSSNGSDTGGSSSNSNNYGWKLINDISISDAQDELILDKLFEYSNFTNYRLAINNLRMSEYEARVHIRIGENINGETVWSESAAQYIYNTFDYVNSMNRSGSFNATDTSFGLGNSNISYRYRNCPLNGYIEIFNTGNLDEDIHLTCHLTYLRKSSDGARSKVGSWYFMTFVNLNAREISGMKFYTDSGNFTAGRLRLFGLY